MKLTFSRFGKLGRLGNQLFQLASMIGFSKKYDRPLIMPQWDVSNYLEPSHHFIYGIVNEVPLLIVDEPLNKFHYSPDFFDGIYSTNRTVDVKGWLQTEKYWLHCQDAVRTSLQFKKDVLDKVSNIYIKNKRTLAISVRVGDYFNNENYEWLSAEYFYLALFEHFPNWQDYDILIFSDDIPYCKVHFTCLSNVTFVENLTPMEQLALGSLCDDFIISNSTFAWWLAYLGLKPDSKVIRPNYHFAGPLLKSSDWRDYYPDDNRYIVFDHKNNGELKKLDLQDVTFVIPVHYDHDDRYNNALVSISMLKKYFNTNIIIGEQGSDMFKNLATELNVKYIKHTCTSFHRTQMLNELTTIAQTPIVVNFDADVLIPPLQLYLAAMQIRTGLSDFVYPYDGRFASVNRRQWFDTMYRYLDAGLFKNNSFSGTLPGDEPSQGGAVMYRKSTFLEAGGENENFISYAPEDRERIWRFKKLGYNVNRIDGTLYHLDHFIGPNSSMQHQYSQANNLEYTKIQQMDIDELRRYISSWIWIKKYK